MALTLIQIERSRYKLVILKPQQCFTQDRSSHASLLLPEVSNADRRWDGSRLGRRCDEVRPRKVFQSFDANGRIFSALGQGYDIVLGPHQAFSNYRPWTYEQRKSSEAILQCDYNRARPLHGFLFAQMVLSWGGMLQRLIFVCERKPWILDF